MPIKVKHRLLQIVKICTPRKDISSYWKGAGYSSYIEEKENWKLQLFIGLYSKLYYIWNYIY